MLYAFPIPVVRAILEDSEGRILLLRRRGKVEAKSWCLPGGKVEYGQTVEQAVKEEVKEETGLDVKDVAFLFYQERLPRRKGVMHCIHFYFSANHSGTLNLNEESYAACWMHSSEFGDYPIAFGNDEAVRRYLSEKENHR